MRPTFINFLASVVFGGFAAGLGVLIWRVPVWSATQLDMMDLLLIPPWLWVCWCVLSRYSRRRHHGE